MSDAARFVAQMGRIIKDDEALMGRLRTDADPFPVLEEVAKKAEEETTWREDRFLYRTAVVVLGSLGLIAAVGAIILEAVDKTTPEVLVALGSAAVGALVGLFAPSPAAK